MKHPISILSIPALAGGASHLIPLFVLEKRYFNKMSDINNAFLVAEEKHNTLKELNVNVAPIDYKLEIKSVNDDFSIHKENLSKMESQAYNLVQPNIILEDNSFNTPLIAEKNNIPRISIHRTGFFRSLPLEQRNSNHVHSLEKGMGDSKMSDASVFLDSTIGNPLSEEHKNDTILLKNYLSSKTKLIPGIPSLEVLPENIEDRESYFYTGPLIMEDNPSDTLLDELKVFIQMNKNSKTVFITTGLIDTTSIDVYVNHLLNMGYAIISTINIIIDQNYQHQFFYNRFLPLNYVCSIVDLVIHQCGSGMYHYPILNEKPTLTIGTQCYDREDVAIRLEQLGVSKHIPHPNDDPNYLEIFKTHLRSFENNQLCDFKKLGELKDEIYETMLNFDMQEVINYTLN